MKKLIFFLVLILMSVSADAQVYLWRYRSHATDCTALTDGKLRDLCYEEDSQDVYKCVPSAGDCSGSEWKLVGNEFLKNISEDPTPQLGGELDGQGNSIIDLGDVTFRTGAQGGTLRTGTSAADKFTLQAYDVDGGAYVTLMEADAGNSPIMQLFTDLFHFEDSADPTKILDIDISTATASTTTTLDVNSTVSRTISLPDATDTLVGRATTDTLTNKTINTASNTITIVEADISDLAHTVNTINIQHAWKANGNYIVDTSVDGGFISDTNFTITGVWLYRTDAGSSSSTIIDLNKNGTTMYTTQGNRPTIAFNDGDLKVDCTLPDITSVSSGDILTIDTDQVEAGSPANYTLIIEGS